MSRKLRGRALMSFIAFLATMFLFGDLTEIRNLWGGSSSSETARQTSGRYTTAANRSTAALRKQNSNHQQQAETEADAAILEQLKATQDLVRQSSQETAEWKEIAKQKDQKLDQLTSLVEKLVLATSSQSKGLVAASNDENEQAANLREELEALDAKNLDVDAWSSWINSSSVELREIVGDPEVCTDVIYTGDNRDYGNTSTFVGAHWMGLTNLVKNHKNKTTICAAFFKIPNPFLDVQDGVQRQLHPVWARLPATALIMNTFLQATHFLYMDTDALPAYSDDRIIPRNMYKTLSYDGYGETPSYTYKHPGLIANKPATGWMCSQCEKFGLGHGCFNTGVLLWRKSTAAQVVIKAWWESRLSDHNENFVVENDDGTEEEFPFWEHKDESKRLNQKMGEQTRLYYVYATNPDVHEAMWPVPQQKSSEFNSSSCPNGVHGKMPCLQYDIARRVILDPPDHDPSCFINHYPDYKENIIEQAQLYGS